MTAAKTTAVYAPATSALIYVTELCNLDCPYCFLPVKRKRMSRDTARKIARYLYSRDISGAERTINVTFFGGEPFTAMDVMEEIVAQARQQGPNAYKVPVFSATTNGTVATERAERLIRETRMRLLVSMDGGHGPSRYRPFHSGASSYEVVARNLPKLASWASDTVVRMTFHPGNLDLLDSVRHVLALGAPSIALCPVAEADWAGHEEALENAYQELADAYIAEARAGRVLPLEMTHLLLVQRHRTLHGGARQVRPCGVGRGVIGIDTEGNVLPCHRFLYRTQDRLGTIDNPRFNERRTPFLHSSSRAILGCDTCVAEPVCGGGCRAVVLDAGGDMQTGAHPGYCLTTRAHARAVYRIYDTLMTEQNPTFLRALRTQRPLNPAFTDFVS